MIPELEALDDLAVEIREAARIISRDWPQIFTEDEMTARLSSELIDREAASDLASIETRSQRMWILIRLGTQIVNRERLTYESGTGIELIPTQKESE